MSMDPQPASDPNGSSPFALEARDAPRLGSPPLAADLGARSSTDAPPAPLRWKKNAILFLATVLSVFLAGAHYAQTLPAAGGWGAQLLGLARGWTFAVPLLAILLTHEFGHYFAARYHKVDASLPYFIPLPVVSYFGTMGAVISMRGRIKSRNALLDIGASGPLCGLVVALPVLAIGLAQSPVEVMPLHGELEGQSLIYLFMKRVMLGPIAPGYDVIMSPAAFAGWTGLLVTALNLIPIGQLDGGHIAYALFDRRQHRYARILHWSLLGMFAYNLVRFLVPVALHGTWRDELGGAFGNSLFWLFWFGLLHLLARIGGRDHPPTEPGVLSPKRRWIAVLCLGLFVLLFMPTPWTSY